MVFKTLIYQAHSQQHSNQNLTNNQSWTQQPSNQRFNRNQGWIQLHSTQCTIKTLILTKWHFNQCLPTGKAKLGEVAFVPIIY